MTSSMKLKFVHCSHPAECFAMCGGEMLLWRLRKFRCNIRAIFGNINQQMFLNGKIIWGGNHPQRREAHSLLCVLCMNQPVCDPIIDCFPMEPSTTTKHRCIFVTRLRDSKKVTSSTTTKVFLLNAVLCACGEGSH